MHMMVQRLNTTACAGSCTCTFDLTASSREDLAAVQQLPGTGFDRLMMRPAGRLASLYVLLRYTSFCFQHCELPVQASLLCRNMCVCQCQLMYISQTCYIQICC
jgi:hypothetical protein